MSRKEGKRCSIYIEESHLGLDDWKSVLMISNPGINMYGTKSQYEPLFTKNIEMQPNAQTMKLKLGRDSSEVSYIFGKDLRRQIQSNVTKG